MHSQPTMRHSSFYLVRLWGCFSHTQKKVGKLELWKLIIAVSPQLIRSRYFQTKSTYSETNIWIYFAWCLKSPYLYLLFCILMRHGVALGIKYPNKGWGESVPLNIFFARLYVNLPYAEWCLATLTASQSWTISRRQWCWTLGRWSCTAPMIHTRDNRARPEGLDSPLEVTCFSVLLFGIKQPRELALKSSSLMLTHNWKLNMRASKLHLCSRVYILPGMDISK